MNVVITGTSSGIGAALVACFESDPHVKKIFACSSSVEKAELQGKIIHVPLDFTSGGFSDELLKVLAGEPVNILINNAGYLKVSSFHAMRQSDLRKIFQVNFEGPFQLIQALIPFLTKGKAHVVNIGSMGGFQGSGKFAGLSGYSASKAALANLTECLAEEFRSEGIRCNCLALGAVQTQMLREAFPNYQAEISAHDMAAFIKNFAISSGNLFNGKIIPVSSSTP